MNNRSAIYVILSAIIFLFFFGIWFLLFSSVQADKSRIVSLETEIVTNKNREATFFSDTAIARDVSSPSDALVGLFASSSNVAYLVEVVEEAAASQDVNVSIDSISTSALASSTLSSLSLSLSASGTWDNLIVFAAALENLQYDIVLDKVSFFKNAGDPKNIWHFQADAKSFISN
jgi:hypothetical protein